MNTGKRFENNFKKSAESVEGAYIYRLRDSGSSFSHGENTRFTQKNICDFILYKFPRMYLCEAKSTKQKSLPLSMFGKKQLEDLVTVSKKEIVGLYTYAIVEFSSENRVFALAISSVDSFVKTSERKSIPISYFESNGIELEVTKMKSNIKINLERLLV